MELTPLETDFLGDLAQDDHQLFEVFQFVRHHHGHEASRVRAIGRALLASWIARGWLTVVSADHGAVPPSAATDIAHIIELVDRAATLDGEFPGSDTWLRLTEQASADVEWIGPAT